MRLYEAYTPTRLMFFYHIYKTKYCKRKIILRPSAQKDIYGFLHLFKLKHVLYLQNLMLPDETTNILDKTEKNQNQNQIVFISISKYWFHKNSSSLIEKTSTHSAITIKPLKKSFNKKQVVKKVFAFILSSIE